MRHIHLDFDDYFSIVRAIVFAEIKNLRKISDVFGDELRLSPDSSFGKDPLTVRPEELETIAGRAAGFFGLAPENNAVLAGLSALGDWSGYLSETAGPRPKAITFFTSGSTGVPKPVVREYFFLQQDAAHLADMLHGTRRVIGLWCPRMSGAYDPRPLLSPVTARLYEAVLSALDREPTGQRPLVWNDDEQSLETMILALTRDIVADGRTANAVGNIVAALR